MNTDLNKVRDQIINISWGKAFLSQGNSKFQGAKAGLYLLCWRTSEIREAGPL